MQNALRRNVPLVALFHWNDSLRRVVFVEVATPVSSRNGVFVRRNVRDPESDDIATSPFAAATGYRDEPTGADGYGHDGR